MADHFFSKRDFVRPEYAEGLYRFVQSDPAILADYRNKSTLHGGISILEYCIFFAPLSAERYLKENGYVK